MRSTDDYRFKIKISKNICSSNEIQLISKHFYISTFFVLSCFVLVFYNAVTTTEYLSTDECTSYTAYTMPH